MFKSIKYSRFVISVLQRYIKMIKLEIIFKKNVTTLCVFLSFGVFCLHEGEQRLLFWG